MKVYSIGGWASDPNCLNCVYVSTLAEARSYVRKRVARYPHERAEVLVHEMHVATDKPAVLALLNEEGPTTRWVTRVWGVGPRGGLKEEPRGAT